MLLPHAKAGMDVCHECGYKGTFNTCPSCGGSDIMRLRRVSGYLSESRKMTKGKQAELQKRSANRGIRKVWALPKNLFLHIVKVAYDLNRADKDELGMPDLGSKQEVEEYLRKNVPTEYFPDDFPALSAVGDFALIRRFRCAIKELRWTVTSFTC